MTIDDQARDDTWRLIRGSRVGSRLERVIGAVRASWMSSATRRAWLGAEFSAVTVLIGSAVALLLQSAGAGPQPLMWMFPASAAIVAIAILVRAAARRRG